MFNSRYTRCYLDDGIRGVFLNCSGQTWFDPVHQNCNGTYVCPTATTTVTTPAPLNICRNDLCPECNRRTVCRSEWYNMHAVSIKYTISICVSAMKCGKYLCSTGTLIASWKIMAFREISILALESLGFIRLCRSVIRHMYVQRKPLLDNVMKYK